MPCSSNLLERIVERLELWVLELGVVEPKEVVHDDVAGQGRESMGQVHGFLPGFKLLHADRECVDVAVDDVDEVQYRASREPGARQPGRKS
jgi:hypothetical protein